MRTKTDNELKKAVAEELRLIHKEFGWVLGHVAKIHGLIRPEDDPPIIEDPRQLKLFSDDENDTQECETGSNPTEAQAR